MKKPFLLLLALCCFTAPSFAQKKKPQAAAPGLQLKNDDVLVYEVNNNGDIYHFEVTIKEIREAIVFDWVMPEKDFSGEVTLEKTARDGATTYANYFANGSEKIYTDTCTVWFSRKNFAELKKGSTICTIDQYGAERFDKKPGAGLAIQYKGKPLTLKTINATNGKTGDAQRQLWMLDNAANPLIVKMNLGWTIVLKEIKTVQ
jgi:hypothetical protein